MFAKLSLFKFLAVLGLSSLKIVSTKELTGAANGATRIFYSITGQATIALDNFAIFGNFQSLLSKGAIRGVTALPTAFSLNGQIVADISGTEIVPVIELIDTGLLLER